MPIYSADQERLKRICKHEAGHLVVAKEMKFVTHGIKVTLLPNVGHAGDAAIEPRTANITEIDHVKEYLIRRIRVLYSGVIAECADNECNFDNRYAKDEWERGGGMNDFTKIRELLQTLRNISYPQTVEEEEINYELALLKTTLTREACDLVKKRHDVIKAVAEKLYEKVISYNVQYYLTEGEIAEISQVIEFLAELE
jgi:hypothetical protein